jgi:hypothetical protein
VRGVEKRTRPRLHALVATLLACLLLPASVRAAESEPPEVPGPSTTAKVLDALILRPLGLAVIPVGVAAFIPTALLAAPGGLDSVRAAYELFIEGPVNYVFQRPLGDV